MPGESVITWVCNECGAAYRAVLNETSVANSYCQIRPGTFQFDGGRMVQPPEAVATAVRRPCRGVLKRRSLCQNPHTFCGIRPSAVIRAETAGGVPQLPNLSSDMLLLDSHPW